MGLDETRRRTGRRAAAELLEPDELRTHTVSSRMNVDELAVLDRRRAVVKMGRGEYLRCAMLGAVPRSVPELNRLAWAQLARLTANLNQHQAAINAGTAAGFPPDLLIVSSGCNLIQKQRLNTNTPF